MKLRTVMRGFADGTYYAAVKAGDTADAINHDAAVAHALMQAMREGDEAAGRDISYWVKRRADSIMRSWGFDTREDA